MNRQFFQKSLGFLVGGVLLLTAMPVMAAISFGSTTSTANSSGGASTLVLSKPSSTASGDFLIAGIVFNSGEDKTISAPSGWTLIERTDRNDEVGIATYRKIAGGSEPSTYSWGISSSGRAAGGITRYTGVSSTSPIVVSSESEGHSTSAGAPSVTTTAANQMVLVFYGIDDNDTLSTPSGTNLRFNLDNSDGSGPRILNADFTKITAGSTGTTSSLIGGGNEDWIAQTIVLMETPATTATLTVTKVVANDSGGALGIGDFPLFLDGMAISSGVATTTSVGSHTISEANQTGYAGTITGDCASDGTITLAGGDNKSCTITNDDQPGHLTIVKNTVGGDGTFDFTVGGPSASSPSITSVNASSTSGPLAVSAGTYSVAEAGQTGWDISSASCNDGASTLSGSTISGITIPLNGNVTCTFTNTKRASITVIKDVVDSDGGTVSDNHSFTIHRDSESGVSISEGSNKVYENLVPGTYTISEDSDSAYDFVSFSQDGDTEAAGAQITVAAGENTSLTITNKQRKATLTIVKNVTNHDIGTSDANDFSFSLNGADPVSFLADEGAMTGQNEVQVNPGAYTVTEPVISGYAQTLVGCSGTLTSSSTATCTITNSDIPTGQGAITVVKSVINDNGGDAVVGDFELFIGATSTANGTAQFLDPGSYTVSEGTLPSGYTQTGISCTNGVTTTTDGSVTLGDQDAWVCTITNDDQPGTLHIVKTIVNSFGGTAISTEFSFSVNEQPDIVFEADGQNDITVDAGTYSVAEFSDSRYTTTYDNCASIVIANGGEATCTITNTAKPVQLTIVKRTDSLSGDGSFSFNITDQEGVTLSTEGNSATSSTMNLSAGLYDVTETVPGGWTLSSTSCVNGEATVGTATSTGRSLTLQNGDSVTCTFTNTKRATLTVKKIVINDNAGTKAVTDFTFQVNGGDSVAFEEDGQNDLIVDAGSYAVTEPAVSGYTTTYENCSEIILTNGGSATCTITNNDNPPQESAPTPSTPNAGGNGPIAGAFGFSFGGGSVLGTSTVGSVLGTSTQATDIPQPCTTEYIKEYMRRGAKNNPDEVKKLQEFLNENLSLKIPVTGFFGPATFDGVKKFQLKYSNEILAPWTKFGHPSKEIATGNVYKMTKWWINALKCQPLTVPAPQLP